jgi:hypothetical protein
VTLTKSLPLRQRFFATNFYSPKILPLSRLIHYSQLCAKVEIPDIYLIPHEANKAGEGQGVFSQFNEIVIKIGR